ncbi:MAG TPA: L-aspartate oxidase [Candidatus Saccharimonadales bacterium]|nr:L-aspartate oxidase [Candidatus Saccharimonadales bacterium]
MNHTDYLVLGSGIGGLTYALHAAGLGRVTILTKKERSESNTNYAQGGVASVTLPEDDFELHIRDTLQCGAGLCDPAAVRMVVEEGPAMIRELLEWGVRFDRDGRRLAVGREGGHTRNRIVHARDATGREIERALLEAVRRHRSIRLLEHHLAVDLILASKLGPAREEACLGAYVLEVHTGRIVPFTARATVLATGGAGKVYLYTTNPDIATGDGVAMAYRAGAAVADMEFVQFHPTCLYHPEARHPEARSFLISEAVRGEGGVLLNGAGRRFMKRYHRMAELAPRDVVARSIDNEMKLRGDKHVWLDVTRLGAAFVRRRFPNIYARCREFGIDITREPIPVVPAAHYMCGGVRVDLDARTSVPRLLAVGECAMSGLHGANRLASNSLLEALVYARQAAETSRRLGDARRPRRVPAWRDTATELRPAAVLYHHNWEMVRRLMWDLVGIVRTDGRLRSAARRLRLIREEIEAYYWRHRVTPDIVELRNLALVAELVVRSARSRRESRGLHYNLDHPRAEARYEGRHTVLRSAPHHGAARRRRR